MKITVMRTIILSSFLAILFSGCTTSPDFPDIPVIEFTGFTKTLLRQGSVNNDSTYLSIYFEDGDGDIGYGSDSPDKNLYIIDNRTGEIYDRYKVPALPEEGSGNGVSGTIRLLMFSTCCIFPDNIPPCESPDLYPTNDISFDIYLEDRAGNKSNTITTPEIVLMCD